MTFDLTQEHRVGYYHGWQYWYEAFCICRVCHRATLFVLSQRVDSDYRSVHKTGLVNLNVAVNRFVDIESYVSLKDTVSLKPPEHLPEDVEAAFREGAACRAIGCYNASGTMFRLCIDLATRSKLPDGEASVLNAKTRRDLGLRLPWLFDNGLLPDDLRELATCVREDGNDGAHAGSLIKDDVDDLADFASAILDRIYTKPERLRQAHARRDSRRDQSS